MSQPIMTLMVAVADNGVIGYQNRLPWHLPADLKYFKETTMGKALVMGRKTWVSLGKPLPGRLNLVVSRQKDFFAQALGHKAIVEASPASIQSSGAVETYHDFSAALVRAKAYAHEKDQTEFFVIGGQQLYEQSLPMADRINLTRVHLMPLGDATFPPLNATWQCVQSETVMANANSPSFTREIWEQVSKCLVK